jgi:hypothetical protein
MEGKQVGGSDSRVESPRFDSHGGCWDKIPAQYITSTQCVPFSWILSFCGASSVLSLTS